MKVSAKGRVTIPREIREHYGMTPGTEVEFATREGQVIVKPVDADKRQIRFERALQRARGAADTGLTTDEIMAMTRGED